MQELPFTLLSRSLNQTPEEPKTKDFYFILDVPLRDLAVTSRSEALARLDARPWSVAGT